MRAAWRVCWAACGFVLNSSCENSAAHPSILRRSAEGDRQSRSSAHRPMACSDAARWTCRSADEPCSDIRLRSRQLAVRRSPLPYIHRHSGLDLEPNVPWIRRVAGLLPFSGLRHRFGPLRLRSGVVDFRLSLCATTVGRLAVGGWSPHGGNRADASGSSQRRGQASSTSEASSTGGSIRFRMHCS